VAKGMSVRCGVQACPGPNSAVCTQSHVSVPQSRLRSARSQSVAWQGSYGSGVYPSMVSFLRYGMDLNSKTYARTREWLLKMAGDVKYWIKIL
jgi:hypothetical protein